MWAEGTRGRPAARRRPPRARHRAPPSGFGAPAPTPCRERRRNTTHARRGIPSSKPSPSPRGESLNTSVIKRARHVNTRSGTNRAKQAPRRYLRKHIRAHGSTPPADRPTPCARAQARAARMPSDRARPATRGQRCRVTPGRTRPIAQLPAPPRRDAPGSGDDWHESGRRGRGQSHHRPRAHPAAAGQRRARPPPAMAAGSRAAPGGTGVGTATPRTAAQRSRPLASPAHQELRP